mgnify:CR=1 FL=1
MKNEEQRFTNVYKGEAYGFRPLTDGVFLSTELTLLQKLIMTDIVSYQANGEKYCKTSTKLAHELSMSKRTIQSNFQQLQKKNIIRTKMVHTKGEMSKRYAELIDLNRWVS